MLPPSALPVYGHVTVTQDHEVASSEDVSQPCSCFSPLKTDNSGPAKESNNCSTSERAQPTEGVWSSLRAKVLNFAVGGIDQLTVLIKNRLKPMQYRPDLLDGFIAETGLVISDPE